jgi:hypothetical protein
MGIGFTPKEVKSFAIWERQGRKGMKAGFPIFGKATNVTATI